MPECKALKNHMCISLTGKWTPCCRFTGEKKHKVNEVTFNEYRNSEFFKNIQADMKTGWADGCIRCKIDEERIGSSYRNFFNENYFSDEIEFIEINLSNKCNLSCRMCSPTYSSTWTSLLEKNANIKHYFEKSVKQHFDISKLFDNINLEKLKRIKYLGGEPFITPEIDMLLKFLEDNNIIQNLDFECNTNCTFFPKKLLPRLKKFKNLNVSLSIDGYGTTNDYIRHGKSWNTIYKNILEWNSFRLENSNISLCLSPTIQAYNLHDVKNIEILAKDLGIEVNNILLMHPDYLSINVLPESYLDEIRDEYNTKYYKSIKQNNKFDEFIKFTKDIDAAFKTDYRDFIPLLEKYMEKK